MNNKQRQKLWRKARRDARQDLLFYVEYRKILDELIDDRIHARSGSESQAARSLVSDPTAAAAMRGTQTPREKYLQSKCDAIEQCLMFMSGDMQTRRNKQRMVEMVYFRRTHTTQGAAMELDYSVRTIQRWQAEILDSIAIQLGYK